MGEGQDGYLSTRHAAAFLGVSIKAVQAWRHRGEGPAYYRVSHSLVLYRLEDLRRWLEPLRVEPARQAR